MILFMTFHLVQRVDQSEWVRVEQHSDENQARQRGCDLSAAGRAVLCGQQLRRGWGGGVEVVVVGGCSCERTRILTVPRQQPSVCGKRCLLQAKVGPVD